MRRSRPAVPAAALAVVLLLGSCSADLAAGRVRTGERVLYVIGDSWSAGLHADPSRTLAQDAAADLSMTAVVDAESGTGYVAAPTDTETYAQRAAAIPPGGRADLVVVQGGSNDAGTDPAVLRAAVARTVEAVEAAFPRTRVVLLGPGPDPWPVTAAQAAVDVALRRQAAASGVVYISPMAEHWFTAADVHSIIDPGTDHPTVAGHAVLGRLLARDLRPLLPRRSR